LPSPPAHTIPAESLRGLITHVFTALDVTAEDTARVVVALMEATLSGYDAHGVMRVPRYADELRRDEIDPRGAFTLLRETAASAYVDAGNALGPVTAARAVELACQKAASVGIGCVSTTNSNDIGRLGSYLRQPALDGFITLLVANDSGGLPTVTPFGGAARFFSTNPLAAGIPRGQDEPILIDMSTSVTSVGRLKVEAQRGANIPAGWLIDARGEAVLDPTRFFEQSADVFLLPLGGAQSGHKGFALQLLVEVLAGALGDAGVVTGTDTGREANAIFVLAVDPAHFASRELFVARVNEMVAGLENVPPLPGVERIRLPGARAAAERARRMTHGIPLAPQTRAELARVLHELDLDESTHESIGEWLSD
jgi:LDH2 family malate/lactate/ureidoglycolate dehydrogenase